MSVIKISREEYGHVNEDLSNKPFQTIMDGKEKTEGETSAFKETSRGSTNEVTENNFILSTPADLHNRRFDMSNENKFSTQQTIDKLNSVNEKPSAETEGKKTTRECGPVATNETSNRIVAYSRNSCNKEFDVSNQNESFIRIPRSLIDHECWKDLRSVYYRIFFIIIKNCTYKPTVFYSNGRKIPLGIGQFCTTFRGLVELINKNTRYKEDKIDLPLIQRAVSKFTQLGLSIHQTIHDKTIITITHKDTCELWKNSNDTENDTRTIQDRYIKELSNEVTKEEQHPSPSSPKTGVVVFSKKSVLKEEKILVAERAFLTKKELEDCIKVRGSRNKVEEIINQIFLWQDRESEIKNWVPLIKKWNLKKTSVSRSKENEKYAQDIEKYYFESDGWTARIYHDKMKDQKGILFEGKGAYFEPIFIAYSDSDFKNKVQSIMNEKKMKSKCSS